jgi:hypothetical protein
MKRPIEANTSPIMAAARSGVARSHAQRGHAHGLPALASALAVLAACSGGGGTTTGTGGRSAGSGGATTTTGSGGAAAGTGGASASTGGATSATGGTSAGTGGATSATGGATATGSGGSTGSAGGSAGASAGSAAGGTGNGTGGRAGATAIGGAIGAGGRGGNAGALGTGGRGGTSGTGGSSPPTGPLPAFPGADGAAARIKGGRGGSVYHVTKLDTDFSDTAPGTLRYGLMMVTGPHTIVFDVSGVIHMGRTAVSGWDANGNGWDTASRLNIPSDVTIAGQTAPGPIIIMGGTVKPGGTNIIIRNVMFAPGYGSRSFDEPTRTPAAGDFPDSYTYDALDISGTDVMIDHVTTVYATDETVSMNELANNITIQYCNISQGQNYPQADAEATSTTYTGHALGSLFQAGSNAKISVLHSLYAHLKGRLPRVGTEAAALTVAGVGAYNDFRNNVFYNWIGTAGTGASGQASQNNFINNFYLAGPGGDNPSGGTSTDVTTAAGGTTIFAGSDATLTKVYQAGNVKDINKDSDANDTTALASSDFATSSIQNSAYTQTPYYGVTDTAPAAFMRVLDYTGARWWSRGAIDTRIISETRAGTGKIVAWADDPFDTSAQEGVEWRTLVSTPMTARPAGFDTDNDGMPNEWETAHGFDPSVADNNGDADNDGYTNLEEYLNEVATWPAAAQLLFTGAKNVRYAEITNWNVQSAPTNTGTQATAYWQPSRYDVAQIQSGTAVVDAVGQHAGTLRVAGATKETKATLNVVNGWLDIADQLEIGAYATGRAGTGRDLRAGSGAVNQSGGTLVAHRAVVIGGPNAGATAVHNFSGGVLTTARLVNGAGGGVFNFTGGTLHADAVGFELIDRGGIISPGNGIGRTDIAADLNIVSGALAIDLSEHASDIVTVKGDAHLGGALRINRLNGFAPKPGDRWTILTAHGHINGRFTSVPAGYTVRVVGNRVIVVFGDPSSVATTSDNRKPIPG